jgi:hypothetical protein
VPYTPTIRITGSTQVAAEIAAILGERISR